MSNAWVLHAPGDAAAAVGVCAVIAGAKAAPAEGPLAGAAARAPLMLLWSRHASGHGALFAEIALAQRGAAIVCRLDDAPADAELAALDVVHFDGQSSGRAFQRAVLSAFIEARRRGRVRKRAPNAAAADWSFVGGVARGLSSSVAMLGMGSLAAVAATDKIDQARLTEDVLSLFGAPITAEASDADLAEDSGLPSYESLRTIVANMQEQDLAQRAEIASRLEEVRRDLIESDVKTAHMLDRLDSLSHRASWRDPSPQHATYVTASAPRTLQEAADLVPARSLSDAARMAAQPATLADAAKAQRQAAFATLTVSSDKDRTG